LEGINPNFAINAFFGGGINSRGGGTVEEVVGSDEDVATVTNIGFGK
jgi:hypothetical protein